MKNKFFFISFVFLSLFFSFGGYSEEKNYYQVLGIEKTADKAEIRSAFIKKAWKYHPDRNPDDKEAEKKMTEINEAYEILKDPHERAAYSESVMQRAAYSESVMLRRAFYNMFGFSEGEFRTIRTQNEGYPNRTFKDIFNDSRKKDSAKQVELKPHEERAIEIFMKEFSFFKENTFEFLQAESRYIDSLKKQQSGQLSSLEKRRLHYYRVRNLKDLEVFKRILYHLGLSYEVLHPVLLETYLNNLRWEWHENKNSQLKKMISDLSIHFEEGENRFVRKEVIRVLREIKTDFDAIQVESLEEGSKILKGNFMKNFGAQFIVFHAALGFSIYMKALYDKKITGFEKNPGELMEMAQQSLTPSGILSFFVFVAVASKVQYRIYGLGRFLDGKTVLGKSWNGGLARSLSPSLGLGAGFLFYSIFSELSNDQNLELCVKEHFKKEVESEVESIESVVEDYIGPCEQFYMNWQAGEKWKILGVDIVSIIGSSIISHKITSSIARHLGRTMIGRNTMVLAMKKLGPKVIRGANFFINLLAFIEVHHVLEKWAGKSVKEQILAEGVSAEVSTLSGGIEYIDDLIKPEFWTQDLKESAKSETQTASSLNSSHLTLNSMKSYRSLQPYQSSLFFERKGVSPPTQDQSSLFFNQTIDSIQSLGNRFRIWTEFVNQDYQSSYYLWTQKLNKRFINYETSLELLDRLFILSQLDYNTTPEEDSSEEGSLSKLSNTAFISDNNFSYKFQSEILYKDRVDYCNLVQGDKPTLWADQGDKPTLWSDQGDKPTLWADQGDKLTLWTDLCENDGDEFFSNPEEMIYETSHLIYNLLPSFKFPDYGFKVESWISLKKDEVFSSDPSFSIQNFVTENSGIDYDKRISLAKHLIKKGLELEALLDGFSKAQVDELKLQKARESFPNYQTEGGIDKEAYNYFMFPHRFSDEIEAHCDSLVDEKKEDLEEGLDYLLEYCKSFFRTSGREEIKKELSLKFLTAGIYILQDFLKSYDLHSHYFNSPYKIALRRSFENVERLIRLIETHKKGERAFLEYVKARESAKNLFSKAIDQIPGINQLMEQKNGNPYFVFYNLICSPPNKVDLDYFSIPQLLSDFDDIELYDFKKKEYEPLSSLCSEPLSSLVSLSYSKEEAIHKFLFEAPARYKGAEYENLYLSVEHIVGSKYKVFDKNLENIVKSEEKTNLMNMYHGKESISGQLKALSETNLSEIQLLMDQFYRKTINRESSISYNKHPAFDHINQELLDYYDQNKVYFNFCSLSSDLSFGGSEKLTGGCEGGFKNIEVSIFQVNHLLKTLKKLLIKGDEIKVCEEGENCQTLNDKFLFGLDEEDNKEGGKKDNKKDNKEDNKWVNFDIMHSQVITELQLIHDCYKDSEAGCLYRDKNLAEVLMRRIENTLDLSLIYLNAAAMNSHWGKIVYSILFEINKSLNNFNSQLLPFTLKRKFEQRLENSGLEKIREYRKKKMLFPFLEKKD